MFYYGVDYFVIKPYYGSGYVVVYKKVNFL